MPFFNRDGNLVLAVDDAGRPADTVRVYNTAAQTIPDATTPETLISFDSEHHDFGGLHNPSTNNSRLTAQRSGVYNIDAFCSFVANSTGIRYFFIRKNANGSGSGGEAVFSETQIATTSPTSSTFSGSLSAYLSAGEYIEMFVYQNSGGNLDVFGGTTGIQLSMSLISPSFPIGTTSETPVGAVQQYAGTGAPAGWLLCNGSAISRTTYAALFAAIGTTYGVGDGSTTFNLPDLRGRVIAGSDTMGVSAAGRLTLIASGVGSAGGLQNATLRAVLGANESNTLTLGYRAVGAAVYNNTTQYTVFGASSTSANRVFNHHTPVYDATQGTTNVSRLQPTMVMNQIIYAGV